MAFELAPVSRLQRAVKPARACTAGSEWRTVQERWLHTIGNLTLTFSTSSTTAARLGARVLGARGDLADGGRRSLDWLFRWIRHHVEWLGIQPKPLTTP